MLAEQVRVADALEGADVAETETALGEAETSAIEPVVDIVERIELMSEAAAALVKEEEAATEAAPEAAAASDVPAGAVRGDGTATCPDEFPVKGNASSMLYHSPGSPAYNRTIPEFCFTSTDAAEAAGFSPTRYEAAQDEAAADAE